MKKNALTFIINMIMLTFTFAQTETKNYQNFAGGSMSFTAGKAFNYYSTIFNDVIYYGDLANSKGFSVALSPVIGKQNENWIIGVNPYFRLTRIDNPNINRSPKFDEKGLRLGAGLFARKLIKKFDKFGLWLSPNFNCTYSIAQGYDTFKSKEYKYRDIGLNAKINPMITYQLSQRLRLVSNFGDLGYYFSKELETTSSSNQSYFNFDLSMRSFYFGAEYLF